ncbi:MAG TPA: HAMP domain-containing sensor histidine kinase [Usitatibacter sp.]|nr:HAMP domain-containing sensor histidine kinase [Usitatibacter sp.]
MLHTFLEDNRGELIARCRAKVAKRLAPRPTPAELEQGIPLFLTQLVETLRIEEAPVAANDPESGGARAVNLRIAAGATRQGRQVLQHGLAVDQAVHGYGDLCQAVTELAMERKTELSAGEFNTLNRCLDNAIADAVTEFGRERDVMRTRAGNRALGASLGVVTHELRSHVNAAMLAFSAIKAGGVGLRGATAAMVDKSLVGLRNLIDGPLAEARLSTGNPDEREQLIVERFLAEALVAARVEAQGRGCEFVVDLVDEGLMIRGDPQSLHSALSNLLHNALRFTRDGGHVVLRARGAGTRVLIEVADGCGGLAPQTPDALLEQLAERSGQKRGHGSGLLIAHRALEVNDGFLRVSDIPGRGCVFTMDLPRHV